MEAIDRLRITRPDLRLPDYGGASILDLVGWIGRRLSGSEAGSPPPFAGLPDDGPRRIVLMLLDGLGDRYLCAEGDPSRLRSARVRTLSSVFPSTTAAAVTTLMTGLSPAAHGLNGWVCRGHGGVGLFEPLPMVYLDDGKPIRNPFRLRRLFPYRTLYQRLECPVRILSPARLVFSDYSLRHARGAASFGYERLAELPECFEHLLAGVGERALVHVYLPHFDATAHDEGMRSERLAKTFRRLDEAFAEVDRICRRHGWLLLATADHGLVDAPESEMLCLGAEPALAERLDGPVWGERRAAFCAIRGGRVDEFAAALERRWPGRCDLLSAAELQASGLLGPGKPHRDLATRIGDAVLLPRGSGTVVDAASPGAVHPLRAVHGGLSADEMEVPLIVAGAG